MPINDRMYTHKTRPSSIRLIKVGQVSPMWICPPRADEDCLHVRVLLYVLRKRGFHREGGGGEGKMVSSRGGLDELVDLGEWVGRDNVD